MARLLSMVRKQGAERKEKFMQVNRAVTAAMIAGSIAVSANVSEVDAFNCGEPGLLRALAAERLPEAFMVACAAGQLAVLLELRRMHGEAVAAYVAGKTRGGEGAWQPIFQASTNGHCAVVEWLMSEVGAKVAEAVERDDGVSALWAAASGDHVDVVHLLLEAGVRVDQAKKGGSTPLFMAAQKGHLYVVRRLMAAGANVNQARDGGWTPLTQVTLDLNPQLQTRTQAKSKS